jgi:hypothetical protein
MRDSLLYRLRLAFEASDNLALISDFPSETIWTFLVALTAVEGASHHKKLILTLRQM